MGQVLGRDPDAGVADTHLDLAVHRLGFECDDAALGREAQPIGDQVDQDLLHPLHVGQQRWQALPWSVRRSGRQIGFQHDAPLFPSHRLVAGHHLVHHLSQGHQSQVQCEFVGVQL